MNVLVVTGSRHGCTPTQLVELRREVQACDCVLSGGGDGVDTQAQDLAYELGKDLIIVPAIWGKRGRPAGPMRNTLVAMVAGALLAHDHDVAFGAYPAADSSGTHDCVRKLREYGVTGLVHQ